METKIIQLTSGKGPAECCLAVALALKELIKEAKEYNLLYDVVDRVPAEENGTLYSATIKLQGKFADSFSKSWEGNLLWIAQSPYRKFHKRKNWFIGLHSYNESALPKWNEKDIAYQTMRASGPGGQNVNKVESAVRATHIPSGLQVMANDSRSQLQNKKMATERLQALFLKWQITAIEKSLQDKWLNHHSLERGNPTRIYSGKEFKKQKQHGT